MPPRAMPRGAMNQHSVFFNREWTSEHDELFVLALCEQTGLGNHLARGNANLRAIRYGRDRVNGHFGTNFGLNYFLDRFRKLRQHYVVFQYIIEQPGVTHDEVTNAVQASEQTWNRICREHALAYAYMRRGEPSYNGLRFIFTAVPDIPVAGNEVVEVIQISSDNEELVVSHNSSGVFDSELAWYNSGISEATTVVSSNVRPRHINANESTSRRGERGPGPSLPTSPPSGPSSQASSSPFKIV